MIDSTGQKVPEWIVRKGVDVIRNQLNIQTILDLRQMIEKDKLWYAPLHFSWGMSIRNLLRDTVCLDNQLPSGNWDDVYHHVIEAACDVNVGISVITEGT